MKTDEDAQGHGSRAFLAPQAVTTVRAAGRSSQECGKRWRAVFSIALGINIAFPFFNCYKVVERPVHCKLLKDDSMFTL